MEPKRPKILVIRGGAIGDFVLTLPAIRLLRENFPSACIEILGYKHIIALAEGRYYAEASYSIEYAALAGFFVPGGELASDLVDYFAGFQQVISYLYDPDEFFEQNVRRCGVKNYLAASPKVETGGHAANQLALPLQSLALYLEDPAAQLYPNPEDREIAARFFEGIQGPVIALHPGSGSVRKNWPIQSWQILGENLASLDLQPTLLIIGGEADYASLALLQDSWKGLPLCWAKDLPLVHLAAILERCTLFIGHDSGISHIAAAVGTSCILMFGETDPTVWGPANSNVKIVRAPEGDLGQLEVETVFRAVCETVC